MKKQLKSTQDVAEAINVGQENANQNSMIENFVMKMYTGYILDF